VPRWIIASKIACSEALRRPVKVTDLFAPGATLLKSYLNLLAPFVVALSAASKFAF